MMKNNNRKKYFALIIALMMLLEFVPLSVSGEGDVMIDESESRTMEALLDAEDDTENPSEEEAFWEEVISKHIDDYTITVTVTKEAEFPIGTTVTVNPLNSNEYRNEAANLFDRNDNELGTFIRVFDITFWYDGMEIEPLVPLDVRVTFDNTVELEGNNELKLIHLHEDETAKEIETETETTESEHATGIESLSFQSDQFSTYIVAEEVVVYNFIESGNNYEVVLKCNSAMGIPENAVFTVEEITKDSDLYEQYAAQVAAVINPEGTVRMPALLDISLKTADGEKIRLDNRVRVIVRLTGENLEKDLQVVHFPGEDPFQGESDVRDAVENSHENDKIEVLDIESERLYARVNTNENTVTFNTDSFSVFALAYTVDFYLNINGENYLITVTYDREVGIPDGAKLEAREILPDEHAEAEDEGNGTDPEPPSIYNEYISKAEAALGWEAGSVSYARLFDIRIVDANGDKVIIGAPVDVKIELADKAGDENAEVATRVVHFADGAETGDVVENMEVDGGTVCFEAEGFSAYAIVEGPGPIQMDTVTVGTPDELMNQSDIAFYLSYDANPIYFTNKLNGNKSFIETTAGTYEEADKWYFEKASDDESTYYRIYTYVNNEKQYVFNPGENYAGLTTDPDHSAVFELSEAGNGRFYFKLSGDAKWLQHSKSGGGVRFWTDNNNAVNSQITIAYASSFTMPEDPCNLDGKSCGLINWNGGVAGRALMASQTGNRLEAKSLTVMRTADNSDQLFTPNDSDITMWTFHWAEDDDYYLTVTADGNTEYLQINSNGLSLVASQEEASRIQVVPGTGVHAGEICLKAGGKTLTYSGNIDEGFSAGGSAGNEWLHLVELSELTSDYFRTWSAQKVSVSDPVKVCDSSSIIVYTRYWNEEKKRYDFYAIDHDGTLVPVYEDGDSIEWTAGQLNTLLWNFTEYCWEGTTDPNYYYELYNPYSGQYLTPQVTGNQTLSGSPIGINLNGRRDGKYYTPILAWDEENYSYVGLKVENGQIVPCPKSEAMDFYFAVMQDLNVNDSLTTIPTMDHTQYGITMKLIDLENAQNINGKMNSYLGSATGGVGTTLVQGLLSTDLGEDGYPTAKGGSLGYLYAGAKEVNHLFIESTYRSSGYFMYDSTQNFASLNNGNSFTVYKELGSYDSGGNKPTLKHGQFFPFNDLKPGVFTSVNRLNTYGLSGVTELSENNPRKYEQLYSIQHGNQKVNPYFAMELEATFDQTPGGLDAWGHDIIFEFTGDDDFWLYVDGELVIDLGGIHSAVPGSVNFRTGVVNVNGKHTTLRELFKSNFIKRYTSEHGNAPEDDEVNEHLKQYFGEDANSTIFRDNTPHTMRIFYMERGAGASNLQMRFNLAAVKKQTVQLSKTLAGVDDPESVKAEFPYQIWYKDQNGEKPLRNALPDNPEQNDNYVFYKDSVNPVKYAPQLTVGGTAGDDGTITGGITYSDVFFLKPGETADINFPEGMTEYRIVECGINTDVYNSVTVNGGREEVTAFQGSGYPANRSDFGIEYASTDSRSRVNYVNGVDQDALRTITVTKKLFREDGETPLSYHDDGTYFTFRLYLASEYEGLDVADMHSYHVKDPDGYYCRWNRERQKFEIITDSNHQGISHYTDLSDDLKKDAGINFTTSIYGTIAKIPAGYTIEIRNVLAGTQYRVEERPREITDGYSFQKYEWNNREKGKAVQVTTSNGPGINGTVVSAQDDPEDPYVNICNLKGWGLRLNKVWSDADYMSERGAAYFAVYTGIAEDNLTMIRGTVRELKYSMKPQTLYWYFLPLPVNVPFDQYEIREVRITGNPIIDNDGTVINDESLDIEPIPHEGNLTINGMQKGETASSDFEYTVLYDKGHIEDGSNVRADTVTNNRPGIILKKSEWDVTTPLAGATFTLKDREGDLIGTFVSDENGLITIAFLRDDIEYILTETNAPQGWYGLQTPLTLTLHNRAVTVSGVDEAYYSLGEDGNTPILTIKDRPYIFKAVKKDRDTNKPLAGVSFSLHKEKTVGDVTTIDLTPVAGYDHLVTDENGVIPGIDQNLPAGTYELREKATVKGYQTLSGYIRFTVNPTGSISLVKGSYPADEVALELNHSDEDASGTISYTMTILNTKRRKIRFMKVDLKNPDTPLSGAKFDLYELNEQDERLPDALYTGLESGLDGMLRDTSGNTVFALGIGKYHLVETDAPDGYNLKTEPVVITVAGEADPDAVTYEEDANLSSNGGRSYDTAARVYILKISNSPGIQLPATGGPGTIFCTISGALLAFTAGAIMLLKKRKRKP